MTKTNYATYETGGRKWKNVYASYPLEALKYQINNMDIEMAGRSRSLDKAMGGYVFHFTKESSDVIIYVVTFEGSPLPMVGVVY